MAFRYVTFAYVVFAYVRQSRYICMPYVLSGIFTLAACGHTATHSLNLIPRHATVGRNVSLQIYKFFNCIRNIDHMLKVNNGLATIILFGFS